ncbi:MAG: Tad domain-containing protein, partial [Alteraurantiacibacter sp.]
MRPTLRLSQDPSAGFLTRLGRDTSGNVLAIVAASLFPMLALIGGGVDMGRAYLAQSRLQQACDAGVLAARKRLGIETTADGSVPASVAEEANRFFNLNYRNGAYGSENRKFTVSIDDDFSITGTASVDVPTTVMAVFDQDEMEVSVDCTSIQHFNDLDIMMVVDTTGSMRHTNAGDSQSRLESLKQVVR